MKRVISFIIAQNLESVDDYPSLVKPLTEIFDIRSRNGESGLKIAEQVVNTILEWENNVTIYDSLEKVLNEKFYIK